MTTSIKVGDAPRVAPWRTDCWWEALALEKPYFSYLVRTDIGFVVGFLITTTNRW